MNVFRAAALAVFLSVASTGNADAQLVSARGFVEARGAWFPQDAPNDDVNAILSGTARVEAFVKPRSWIQGAAGIDLRADSHDQVRISWRVDWLERDPRRSPVSVRRLSATLSRGWFTVDAGKQFIRWGKTDIVTPTDRLAPRDFLNVIDNDFLPVAGVRAVVQRRDDTFEAAWVPRFTPSRIPLPGQRWTSIPAGPALAITETRAFPSGSQVGLRWGHSIGAVDYSLTFFDGFNHLPTFDPAPLAPGRVLIALRYPQMRMYGGDLAIPTRWFIVKGETGYFSSSSAGTDEYVLYVVQLERQTGEWLFIGGYAGEVVTANRALLNFAPDRGTTKAILGRASYTIDTNRTMAFEGAVRQNGDGLYLKGEYSQARGQHWRATVSGALIRGEEDDFLGQYRLNSNLTLALRFSF